jgi:predicted HAD superfamily Cof-like phosphohydrolase
MQQQLNDVLEFHSKFEVNIEAKPVIPSTPRCELRENLIREEAHELLKAIANKDIEKVADGIVDLIYVTLGTAIEFGLQDVIIDCWKEIQRSNMSKLDDNGRPIKREDGKVLKSDNFTKPDLFKIIFNNFTHK